MKTLGPLLPIVTPCDTNGEVDVPGLRDLCTHFADAGCRSCFGGGSTGRGPWFPLSLLCRLLLAPGDDLRYSYVHGNRSGNEYDRTIGHS